MNVAKILPEETIDSFVACLIAQKRYIEESTQYKILFSDKDMCSKRGIVGVKKIAGLV